MIFCDLREFRAGAERRKEKMEVDEAMGNDGQCRKVFLVSAGVNHTVALLCMFYPTTSILGYYFFWYLNTKESPAANNFFPFILLAGVSFSTTYFLALVCS